MSASAQIERHERHHANVTLVLIALVTVAMIALHQAGALRLTTAWPSPGRLALEIALFVLGFEFYFYALHRLLHTRWGIRYHAVHHASKQPRPLSAISFHPLEALAILVYTPAAAWLAPIHLVSLAIGGTLMAASILFAHWGEEVVPERWAGRAPFSWWVSPGVHASHHRHHHENFGAATTLPDRLFGTWRAPR